MQINVGVTLDNLSQLYQWVNSTQIWVMFLLDHISLYIYAAPHTFPMSFLSAGHLRPFNWWGAAPVAVKRGSEARKDSSPSISKESWRHVLSPIGMHAVSWHHGSWHDMAPRAAAGCRQICLLASECKSLELKERETRYSLCRPQDASFCPSRCIIAGLLG